MRAGGRRGGKEGSRRESVRWRIEGRDRQGESQVAGTEPGARKPCLGGGGVDGRELGVCLISRCTSWRRVRGGG